MKNQATTKEDKIANSSSSVDEKRVTCSPKLTLDGHKIKSAARLTTWTAVLEKAYSLEDGEVSNLSVFDSNLSTHLKHIYKKSYVSGISSIFSIYPQDEGNELLNMLALYRNSTHSLNSDLDRISQDLWRSISASTEEHISKSTKSIKLKHFKAQKSQD